MLVQAAFREHDRKLRGRSHTCVAMLTVLMLRKGKQRMVIAAGDLYHGGEIACAGKY